MKTQLLWVREKAFTIRPRGGEWSCPLHASRPWHTQCPNPPPSPPSANPSGLLLDGYLRATLGSQKCEKEILVSRSHSFSSFFPCFSVSVPLLSTPLFFCKNSELQLPVSLQGPFPGWCGFPASPKAQVQAEGCRKSP